MTHVYVFVRTDIPLADQLVQVGHACLEAGRKFEYKNGTHMVLLQVKNLRQLEKAVKRLMDNNVLFELFFEPDDEMGYTALCTEALYGSEREFLRDYKLWKPLS